MPLPLVMSGGDVAPDRSVTFYVRNLYADRNDDTCRPRYIRVIIHPDTEHLRREAERYGREGHARDGDVIEPDTIALFQPSKFRAVIGSDRRTWIDTSTSFAGMLRLSRDHLTPDILAHEAIHAAAHITRLHNWHAHGGGRLSLGDGDSGDAEESFAYLAGGITAVISNRVWDYLREAAA